MSQTNKNENKSKSGKIIPIVIIVLIIAALIGLVVFQQQKLSSGATNTGTTGVVDTATAVKIQERVAKLMLLPDEEAVITPIDNAEEVKAQPFFSQVENGDQVLIFPQAAKIVIYRPSQNIIVNVGPIIDDRAAPGAGGAETGVLEAAPPESAGSVAADATAQIAAMRENDSGSAGSRATGSAVEMD